MLAIPLLQLLLHELQVTHLSEVGLAPFVVAGVHVKLVELVPVGGLQVIARHPPDFQARVGDGFPLLQDKGESKLPTSHSSKIASQYTHHRMSFAMLAMPAPASFHKHSGQVFSTLGSCLLPSAVVEIGIKKAGAACLADVFALGVLEGAQEVFEAGVAGVLPVVLDPRSLQEAQLSQPTPLRLLIEGDVRAADLVAVCTKSSLIPCSPQLWDCHWILQGIHYLLPDSCCGSKVISLSYQSRSASSRPDDSAA